MFLRPLEIEMIRQQAGSSPRHSAKTQKMINDWETGAEGRLLQIKKANDWMKQEYGKPALKPLFGSFWFEGELCILFADTNLGKSILAVQIGDNLTRGSVMDPFGNSLEPGTPVVYLDCEQSAKQFEARYHDSQWGSYLFADEFYRAEYSPALDDPLMHNNYENRMRGEIEFAVQQTQAKVLIIDNITYMRHGTEQAKDALPLMKMLKALKTKHKLSVLALAHTPKRNPYHPITVNDLQGSKMLINFADSAFAIGKSHTMPGIRYLKQIKQRNKQEEYGGGNICLIRQEKVINALQYTFVGYADEQDHLITPDKQATAELHEEIIQLAQKGRSCRQIAKELGVHHTTVGRLLQRKKQNL